MLPRVVSANVLNKKCDPGLGYCPNRVWAVRFDDGFELEFLCSFDSKDVISRIASETRFRDFPKSITHRWDNIGGNVSIFHTITPAVAAVYSPPPSAKVAVGILCWCEVLLPRRLRQEDLGDAIEDMNRLVASGASGARLVGKAVSTAFFLGLNAIREVVSAFAGKKSPGA